MNRRCAKRVAIGTVTGAALGAAIGSFSGNAGRGALIGAVALASGTMGAHMENQRKDFEKAWAPEISAGVIRLEKFPNDQLLVGMTGKTGFEVDSDQIKPGFNSTMDKISGIVNKYGKTHLNVAGYTAAPAPRRTTRPCRSVAALSAGLRCPAPACLCRRVW